MGKSAIAGRFREYAKNRILFPMNRMVLCKGKIK